MNVFPDRLRFEDVGMRGHSRVFQLTASYRYLSSLGEVRVPEGTLTDGASIPEVFWSILYPFGPWFPAAVVHDFLYSPANKIFTRDESDSIFLEAMYHVGVPWHKRHLIHAAVRAFGWKSFRGQPQ
jgi:hypothetical protein